MTARLEFDGSWSAAVTGDPLDLVPRLIGMSLIVSPYADREEREKFFADTFGSQDWLWDLPDVFRFAPGDRKLVGAEFTVPPSWSSAMWTIPKSRSAAGLYVNSSIGALSSLRRRQSPPGWRGRFPFRPRSRTNRGER
ncbi:hypothetical protein [Streptomyces sp. NPDC029526]|uniref:hypothetical protein n=1 Tax=Streptomyces sp. NPDC029526 TaxID=3155728 RepID=UPI0033F35205